jgi:hypothetical protein
MGEELAHNAEAADELWMKRYLIQLAADERAATARSIHSVA